MDVKTIKQLKAIAHPIRYAIIIELSKATANGLTPSHLTAQLKTSFMNLSFHLSKLENAELVFQKKKGKNMYYMSNISKLEKLSKLKIFNL